MRTTVHYLACAILLASCGDDRPADDDDVDAAPTVDASPDADPGQVRLASANDVGDAGATGAVGPVVLPRQAVVRSAPASVSVRILIAASSPVRARGARPPAPISRSRAPQEIACTEVVSGPSPRM